MTWPLPVQLALDALSESQREDSPLLNRNVNVLFQGLEALSKEHDLGWSVWEFKMANRPFPLYPIHESAPDISRVLTWIALRWEDTFVCLARSDFDEKGSLQARAFKCEVEAIDFLTNQMALQYKQPFWGGAATPKEFFADFISPDDMALVKQCFDPSWAPVEAERLESAWPAAPSTRKPRF